MVWVVNIELMRAVGSGLGAISDRDAQSRDVLESRIHISHFKRKMVPARDALNLSISPAGLPGKFAGHRRVNLDAVDAEPGARKIKIGPRLFAHAQHVDVEFTRRVEVGNDQRDVVERVHLQRIGWFHVGADLCCIG